MIVSVDTPACAATLARHRSRCRRPFHETMMIETSGCTRGLTIHVECQPRSPFPGERRRAREAASAQVVAQRFVVDDTNQRVAPGCHVARIEEMTRAAEHLRNGCCLRREH